MNRRLLVKRVSSAADALLPRHAGVTVLIYHRVGGGSSSEVDLDVADFEQQMAHLAAHARVLTLDEAVTTLAGRTTDTAETADTSTGSARPQVVLTFDDGTDDFTDHAVPVLVRHHLPATLYAATAFIDEQRRFPWDAAPTSWSALRDAVATGLVTIGSHTHSHWLLDRLDTGAIEADLDRSIDLIGEHLGAAPVHFAYPKAIPGSPRAEIAVRRRFTSAALATSRVNRPGRTDVHRIWRTPVQRSDGFDFFAAKANGGLRLEGELRALAARLKYRGAAT